MLSPVIWTCNGRELEAEDWRSNTSIGGHDSGHVTIPEVDALDLTQEMVLRATLPGGDAVWEGTLVGDPMIRFDGLADLDGIGHRSVMEGRNERLLYATRDYGLWSDAEDDPYAITGYDAEVQFDVKGNHLLWTTPADATSPGTRGAAIWAPGTPGGLTRYAFDSLLAGKHPTTGSSTLTVKRFTGPTGARTTVAVHTWAAAVSTLSVDQAVSPAEDALVFEFTPGAGFNALQFTARIFNLRVNGIAVGDEMTAAQVIADIGHRCGYDVGLISPSGLQVLPFDVAAGRSWADEVEYLSMLDGGRVPLVLDGGPPRMILRRFEDRVYDVRIAEGAVPTLRPLPRFTHVRVVWRTPAGGLHDVTYEAPGHGLPPGIRRVFPMEVRDPQKDSTLAGEAANALLPVVSQPAYQGTLGPITRARVDGGGEIDPYLLEPGSLLRLADAGPMQSRLLRCTDVSKTPAGVTVGVQDAASAESYFARRDFAAAQMAGHIEFSPRRIGLIPGGVRNAFF